MLAASTVISRFIKLALQLLSRYATWIQANLQLRKDEAAAAAQLQQQHQQQGSSGPADGQTGVTQHGDQGESSRGWGSVVTPEQLASVWHDADMLDGAVGHEVVRELGKRLGAVAQEVCACGVCVDAIHSL